MKHYHVLGARPIDKPYIQSSISKIPINLEANLPL